jgi:hypothetical protein
MMPACRGAAVVLVVALALLGLPTGAAHADDAISVETKALARQTLRLANDAGQFYMVWWLPQGLSQSIIRGNPSISEADADQMLRALEPYLVFAFSRAQVGEHSLVDLHDKADLLRHSRLVVDEQTITAAPADQNDAAAQSALDVIKPTLSAILGRNGGGIEFALYRPMPGMHPPDPTMPGSFEYTLYRKRFQWQLPVWAPAVPVRAPPVTLAAAPVAASPAAPVAASPAAPVAASPAAPVAAPPAAAAAVLPPAAAAVAPVRAPAAAPVPVQRRKIDPVTGEEFPERYDYNPYTGQKLVSQ